MQSFVDCKESQEERWLKCEHRRDFRGQNLPEREGPGLASMCPCDEAYISKGLGWLRPPNRPTIASSWQVHEVLGCRAKLVDRIRILVHGLGSWVGCWGISVRGHADF